VAPTRRRWRFAHRAITRSTGRFVRPNSLNFANSVALFQVAIALGALAALTRNRAIWVASLSLGGVGIALFAMQVFS